MDNIPTSLKSGRTTAYRLVNGTLTDNRLEYIADQAEHEARVFIRSIVGDLVDLVMKDAAQVATLLTAYLKKKERMEDKKAA